MAGPVDAVVEQLRQLGVHRGDPLAVAVAPGVGVGLAAAGGSVMVAAEDPAPVVAAIDEALRPRWVWWSHDMASGLVAAGVRVATCWDLAAVQRLLVGGWRADPARVWAQVQGRSTATIPPPGPLDLFSQAEADEGDPEDPVRADGHLRPDWVGGGWAGGPERLTRWAELELAVQQRQAATLATLTERPALVATARAESAAELLCAELEADGLPLDRAVAERIIGDLIGPRTSTEAEAAAQRRERDARVLRHAPADADFDLRSPGQVKSLLRRIGIEVPDTRAWRLEARRDEHPLVAELLVWRKAERVSTTYGYGWLDEHLGADGRLRGAWSGSDGAAGRMTASAGLHNMPADMRPAVVAEPGHVFVRADLGQIEPRVLAAVSGDRALARAAQQDDMYARVAQQLGVDRAVAKVAMLGAMYGQTTGLGAHALRDLQAAYPTAMAYLDDADRAGQAGRDLRTHGGRLIRLGATVVDEPRVDAPEREDRRRTAARGRYARNAMVQGAAAEFFKMWAATVRARGSALDARIVLCLHDELLVHAPAEHGAAVARLLDDTLQEAAARWGPPVPVRMVADVRVVRSWADAKD